MIARATALSPARIGLQSRAVIYHFTGTGFLLNENEHGAYPLTDINPILNGLSLVLDLYILLYKPNCFSYLRLQTLTLVLVSAITFARELLIITSTLKSSCY